MSKKTTRRKIVDVTANTFQVLGVLAIGAGLWSVSPVLVFGLASLGGGIMLYGA